MKRTPLPARTKPMPPPSKPMSRGSAVRTPQARGGGPARRAGQIAARKTTPNSGPTAQVRRLVLERDGYACACCGVSVIGRRYSLGHRLRASQGGKAVPSNLLVYLGWGGEECHGRIDSRRDPADEAKGYSLRSWQDPAAEPVMLFSEHGSGVTVWLDDLGNYLPEAPEAGAAA